ncbi:hypothetical protein NDU88_006778 [Pleurodeles waltl]|uniref:Uncharacterized protein n=1 Tax=Pleurodeles waltl TaxID=8319 RepID=A0AAV7NRB5_PLEWA|nr:hypothetical protein NDU88_006778 [Pleurodeles waltl]
MRRRLQGGSPEEREVSRPGKFGEVVQPTGAAWALFGLWREVYRGAILGRSHHFGKGVRITWQELYSAPVLPTVCNRSGGRRSLNIVPGRRRMADDRVQAALRQLQEARRLDLVREGVFEHP